MAPMSASRFTSRAKWPEAPYPRPAARRSSPANFDPRVVVQRGRAATKAVFSVISVSLKVSHGVHGGSQ
jgi:hypothetical protein